MMLFNIEPLYIQNEQITLICLSIKNYKKFRLISVYVCFVFVNIYFSCHFSVYFFNCPIRKLSKEMTALECMKNSTNILFFFSFFFSLNFKFCYSLLNHVIIFKINKYYQINQKIVFIFLLELVFCP